MIINTFAVKGMHLNMKSVLDNPTVSYDGVMCEELRVPMGVGGVEKWCLLTFSPDLHLLMVSSHPKKGYSPIHYCNYFWL